MGFIPCLFYIWRFIQLAMDGSCNPFDNNDENLQHYLSEDEVEWRKLHQQHLRERYGYRTEGGSRRRHVADNTENKSCSTVNEIYEPLTTTSRQWRQDAFPEVEGGSSGGDGGGACQLLDTETTVVNDQGSRTEGKEFDSTQCEDSLYVEKIRNITSEEFGQKILKTLDTVSKTMKKNITERRGETELITPSFINQFMSVNSLIPIHNVTKIIADEPIICCRDDYITDKVEADHCGKTETGSSSPGKFIKVVDFCREAEEMSRKRVLPPRFPFDYSHSKVYRRLGKTGKGGKNSRTSKRARLREFCVKSKVRGKKSDK